MRPSIEISLDHDDPRKQDATCDAEIELGLDYTPGEMHGSDADGNRGVWHAGYYEWLGEIPATCTECGHVYTEEEKERLAKEATQKSDEYDDTPDYPDCDYDPIEEL